MNKRQYKKALKKAIKGWQLERKEYFRYHMLFRKYLMRAMRQVNEITGYHIEYSTDITFSFNVDPASPGEDKTVPAHQQIYDICFNPDGTKKEEII